MKTNGLLLLLFLCLSTKAQSNKEKNFIKTTQAVLNAWNNKDSLQFSKLLTPSIGLYWIYTNESNLDYRHFKTPSFNDTNSLSQYTAQTLPSGALHIDTLLPTYDCNTMTWNKYELFCDTSTQSRLISYLLGSIENHWKRKVPTHRVEQLYTIQKNSRQVLATAKDGSLFIFYMSYLKNNWCLTAIDYRNTECDN